ncbi:2OG-Fe(II) oxygenase family protein [Ceratobasidium sp. AG-Ba]|nr:2OG-Fe(II) oxygenase family protein [Ceratobasidium sp. AG-Ba]
MGKRKTASSPSPAHSGKKRKLTGEPTAEPSRPSPVFEQFKPTSEFQQQYKLDLLGADAYYKEDFIEPDVASEWYEELNQLHTWYRPTLKVYGRNVIQSRTIAAYATSPSLTVKYSGHPVELHTTYPPTLRRIQDMVESELGVTFNHVMLNRYEDGNVYIGKHSDNKENKVIASVSLGAVRTFIMTPKITARNKHAAPAKGTAKRWDMANGSLFVMQGDTQANWKHEIPKQPHIVQGRISLTFRQLIYD